MPPLPPPLLATCTMRAMCVVCTMCAAPTACAMYTLLCALCVRWVMCVQSAVCTECTGVSRVRNVSSVHIACSVGRVCSVYNECSACSVCSVGNAGNMYHCLQRRQCGQSVPSATALPAAPPPTMVVSCRLPRPKSRKVPKSPICTLDVGRQRNFNFIDFCAKNRKSKKIFKND